MTRRAPGAHSSVEPASVGVALVIGGLRSLAPNVYTITSSGLADAGLKETSPGVYVLAPRHENEIRFLITGRRAIGRQINA
jgi:hypothetical protein